MTKPDQLSTEEKDAKAPKLTDAQAAILASATVVESSLSGQIMHDAEGNPVDPEAEVVQADPIAENAALLQMLVSMAAPALPFLTECYTPEVIGNIAGAYTAVEEKYGWNARGLVGPELALALFALPPSFMAYKLGQAHFAELKAKREIEHGRKPPEMGLDAHKREAIGG